MLYDACMLYVVCCMLYTIMLYVVYLKLICSVIYNSIKKKTSEITYI